MQRPSLKLHGQNGEALRDNGPGGRVLMSARISKACTRGAPEVTAVSARGARNNNRSVFVMEKDLAVGYSSTGMSSSCWVPIKAGVKRSSAKHTATKSPDSDNKHGFKRPIKVLIERQAAPSSQFHGSTATGTTATSNFRAAPQVVTSSLAITRIPKQPSSDMNSTARVRIQPSPRHFQFNNGVKLSNINTTSNDTSSCSCKGIGKSNGASSEMSVHRHGGSTVTQKKNAGTSSFMHSDSFFNATGQGLASSKSNTSKNKFALRSPRGKISSLSAGDKSKKRILTGKETLAACPELLTEYEREEIKNYKQVFFIGSQASKLSRISVSAAACEFNAASSSADVVFDNQHGDYALTRGEHLGFRYEAGSVLGHGSFGQVVRCHDHKFNTDMAIKIIRSKKRFQQQSLVELKVLKAIKAADPSQAAHCIHVGEHFYFRGHFCFSFPLYSINLHEAIKMNQFRGFSLELIQPIAQQLFKALTFLRSQNVIHCDLKPENVLLEFEPTTVDEEYSSAPYDLLNSAPVSFHMANGKFIRPNIKVIDFGSSCLVGESVFTYIQSRFYRAPEVIFGMPYGAEIDVWSCACVLAELLIGMPIFPGENESDQLNCMMEVLGVPSRNLVQNTKRYPNFFMKTSHVPRPCKNSRGVTRTPESKPLASAVGCSDKHFISLISSCLEYDPKRRMLPSEAASHSFIESIY